MTLPLYFDDRLIVPDESLSIWNGALAPWAKSKSPYFKQTIEAIAKHYEFDFKTAWKDLPEKVREVFLRGSGKEEIAFRYAHPRPAFALRKAQCPGKPRGYSVFFGV